MTDLKFFKGAPSWKHTCYVLGVPRSGKSTTLNLIGSVDRVEVLDEPFEIQVIAQKGGEYLPGSETYEEYIDSYMAVLENSVSELVLGRRYNFRKNDKSCVFNIKPLSHVDNAFSRSRRLDAIDYCKSADLILAMAFNDLEKSLPFLLDDRIPNPKIIHVVRDVEECVAEVDQKSWLSDEQLSKLTNLSPGYNFVQSKKGKNIYIPYTVDERHVNKFISAGNRDRALMFIRAQHDQLQLGLSMIDSVPILKVMYDSLVNDPKGMMTEIFSFMGVEPTETSSHILEKIISNRHEKTDLKSQPNSPNPR
ncbi:MAG: sulfotransferase domain-containing protein [Desulfamplus sp.]|nr:sulfotransferase domain-containing protein [Desulfamplus sp.]